MLLTGHHVGPVVTLFFDLTHVTCVALYHIVVTRYSTSVTYGTLCRVSGHMIIYRECCRFEGEIIFYYQMFFTLKYFLLFQNFPRADSSTSRSVLTFETYTPPSYLSQSQQSTKDLYVVGSL